MWGVPQFLCCCKHRACLTTLTVIPALLQSMQAGIFLLTSTKQAMYQEHSGTIAAYCCCYLHIYEVARRLTAYCEMSGCIRPLIRRMVWRILGKVSMAKIVTHGCIMVHLFKKLRPSDPLSFRNFSVKYLICINGTSCHRAGKSQENGRKWQQSDLCE